MGVRWAEEILISKGTCRDLSTSMEASMIGRSESEPIRMATKGLDMVFT